MTTLNLSKGSANAVILMRLLIGWHFLYEGVLKLFNPEWTAKGYLMSADWLTGLFHWLASDGMIGITDFMNVLCLIAVGITLVLGLFERIGAMVGMMLLVLYYLAHPALPGSDPAGAEGSYWLVNKNLVEAAALWVVYSIPTSHKFGLGIFMKNKSNT